MHTFLAVFSGDSLSDAAVVTEMHDPTIVAELLAHVASHRAASAVTGADIAPRSLNDVSETLPSQPATRLYLTPGKAYGIIGIGRTTMYCLLREGRIPAQRVGKKWLIPRSAVEQLTLNESRGTEKASGS